MTRPLDQLSQTAEFGSDDAAFSRYAGGIKMSAAVAVLEELSTRRPTPETIAGVFGNLGRELKDFVRADEAYHLFVNPNFGEAHVLRCADGVKCYELRRVQITILLDKRDPWSWLYYSAGTVDGGAVHANGLIQNAQRNTGLSMLLDSPPFFAVAPFCQRDIPLGFFLFVWRGKDTPEMFELGAARLREGALAVLNYLQRLVANLLLNHYPIHRDTYLPTFMEPVPRRVALLFADIRNFTSAFEAMRLHGITAPNARNPLIGFVKAYLNAASDIIARDGVGGIDKFIGDGIMATFGEYITCPETPERRGEENRALAACLLALYSAAVIVDAFNKLLAWFLKLESVQKFMSEYNERFDLRPGVGINFGEASFDYFGATLGGTEDDAELIGGYLEFTAVGDNVNTAQRMEGIANKPVSEVSIIERSSARTALRPNFTAPIILSRTVFLRVQRALRRPSRDSNTPLADQYQSAVALRGKGGLADVYEITPEEVEGDYILRTVSSLGLGRIEQAMKRFWVDTDGAFRFRDDRAKALINRFCLDKGS